MCLHGCASTASPFRLSLFSLVIISYSPIPFLSHTVSAIQDGCPSLIVCAFFQCFISPQLSPGMHRDFSMSVPWRVQADTQPSSASASSQPISSAVENALSTILRKLPVPLQRKVLKLQLCKPKCGSARSFPNPQNKTPAQQQERHLSVELYVASPHPVQLYCPSPILLLSDVLHIYHFISHTVH